ncbi:MAG: IS66 family transposase [Limosilactobacillus reuteri]|nr:IS66 family transposase [Limosilactobacillus reuteri]
MDETPFQVLDSGKNRSYFWVLRTPKEFAKHQIAYFHYVPIRSGKVISDVLTPDYAGAVMCDDYRGYDQEQLPKATFGSCLIHIRRPFIELVKDLTLKNNEATQAVKLLSRVFYSENNLRYKTSAEKKAQWRKLVKPLLDDFYNFSERIAYPMHKLKDAVKNDLNLKDRIYQIFKIGELPLSNNSVEQSIRPSTIIRKNSLFSEIYRRSN